VATSRRDEPHLCIQLTEFLKVNGVFLGLGDLPELIFIHIG
jgi:hypothetical protein